MGQNAVPIMKKIYRRYRHYYPAFVSFLLIQLPRMIAAHARALSVPLVTHNTGEFSRVPDLVLEDWLD